jgi:hypothetical protein
MTEYKLTKDEVRQNIAQLKFTIDYWENLLNDWPDDAVHLVISGDGDDS